MGVADYDEAVARFGYGVENPLPPRAVRQAPCQEVVLRGDEIDIGRLPHPIYSEGDSGPFIASGIVITCDPDDGIPNAGIYRMEVKGPRTLCLEAPNYQHVSVARLKAEARGEALDVAVAIGTDPVIYYASQAKVGYGVDEIAIAGGIRNKPIDVAPGITVDLNVPASAEIVIEGRFLPGERMQEGPFGEFTGYQTGSRPEPVVEVTAVTHRKQPTYQAVLTGQPTTENHILKTFGHDWSLLQFLRRQFPEVTAATVPTSGGVQYLAVVSIDQDHPGQARKVLLATLASPIRAKVAVVVDSDVDVHNLEKVMWAVTTHSQADTDVMVIPGVAGSRIDPSSPEIGIVALLGIDATRSLERPFPPPVRVPGVDSFEFD
jgi:UbiD family decarboxylase